MPVVVVHGGGPQATELQKRLGLTPEHRRRPPRHRRRHARRHEDGRRRQGQRRPLRRPRRRRRAARSACTARARSPFARCGARPPSCAARGDEPVDLGSSATSSASTSELFALLSDEGYVPGARVPRRGRRRRRSTTSTPTPSPTRSPSPSAAARARARHRRPGVLADVANPASRIARLTLAEAERAIADGSVTRHDPEATRASRPLRAGVRAVHIVGPARRGRSFRAPSASRARSGPCSRREAQRRPVAGGRLSGRGENAPATGGRPRHGSRLPAPAAAARAERTSPASTTQDADLEPGIGPSVSARIGGALPRAHERRVGRRAFRKWARRRLRRRGHPARVREDRGRRTRPSWRAKASW